ncbi:hypothetical protein G7Y89_g12032 [Cudoniella acicularis]|uniref:Flavodoxin-like domain-containing protein n=1 Tax=Cudoniella acicularis TaxID=354080 RepID=A0A8H4VZK5_9HELO|nr:hypothetical protein G7Y89_g12032 [Cudoniella acicularis]
MAPRIAIIYYSLWGHIEKLALAELKGIEKAGGTATIFQVAETLPGEVLKQMYAGPKAKYPVITPEEIVKYDGFLFGIPTRFGNFPAQWKAFWDSTGGVWQSGGLWGKYAGLFVSSGSQGGGQESTNLAAMSTLAHHGLIYVPLGAKTAVHLLRELDEVRGGSAWGAGTFSGGKGERQPSEKELELAAIQGESFWNALAKVQFEA